MSKGVPFLDNNVARHRRRVGDTAVENDPALDRSLQLYWLRRYPAYRQLIRERVSEAAKRAEIRSRQIDNRHKDVDYLGKEIDGCG